jgi:hypothetical protein
MPDQEFQIHVVSDADNSGFQSAAGATQDLTGATGKADDATKEFNIRGRAQFLLFSELNKIVPGLGTALHAAFAGPLAPLIVLGFAIAEVMSKLKEQNAELDRQAESAANPDFLDAINARMEVFRNAAINAQAYADKLADIGEKEETITSQLERQLALDNAHERARAALTSAQKELAIAKIQDEEASGKKTPEQAAEARAAVERQYLEQQQKDKEDFEDQELSRKTTKMHELDANQTGLEKQHQQAVDAETAAKAHRAAVTVKPEEQAKKIADAQAELDEKENTRDDWRAKVTDEDSSDPYDFLSRDYLAKLQADVDQAQAMVDDLVKQAQKSADANSRASDAKIKALEDEAAKADKKVYENKEEMARLNAGIAAQKAQIAPDRPLEHQAVQTKEQAILENERARMRKAAEADAKTVEEADTGAATPELLRKAAIAMQNLNAINAVAHDIIAALPDYSQLIAAYADLQQKFAQQQAQVNALQTTGSR